VNTLSWAERLDLDTGLRAFVEAEIARAKVDVSALRCENERLCEANNALTVKVRMLESALATRQGRS
jgi:hypothetical protein